MQDYPVPAVQQQVCGKFVKTALPEEKPRRVKLGDWRPVLGEKFSGDALYAARFTLTEEEVARAAFIDLGRVGYASEVKVNGWAAGASMLSPFRFPVRGLLKSGVNRVEVVVTNTLANALSGEDTLEVWKKEYGRFGDFEDRQRSFEEESLPSGLFGPVTLRAAE